MEQDNIGHIIDSGCTVHVPHTNLHTNEIPTLEHTSNRIASNWYYC